MPPVSVVCGCGACAGVGGLFVSMSSGREGCGDLSYPSMTREIPLRSHGDDSGFGVKATALET